MKTKRFKIRYFLLVLIVLLFPDTKAQDLKYLPDSVDGHPIQYYTQFALSYNEEHKQAEWVAYELTKSEANMDMDRCDCFKKDPMLSSGGASTSDYSSTGLDLGHLCPAADNNMSLLANEESFYMTNISPQLPTFNRGIWKELEVWVRKQAIKFDTIYVVTGPVFINDLGTVGNNEVTIPGYFYKCVLRIDEDGKAKSIGFLLPHVGAVGSIKNYVLPVNTIETITGLEFYHGLGISKENSVESRYSTKNWKFKPMNL